MSTPGGAKAKLQTIARNFLVGQIETRWLRVRKRNRETGNPKNIQNLRYSKQKCACRKQTPCECIPLADAVIICTIKQERFEKRLYSEKRKNQFQTLSTMLRKV